jgi:hypothetical protein
VGGKTSKTVDVGRANRATKFLNHNTLRKFTIGIRPGTRLARILPD